jgi:hypothetical protein
MSSDIIINYIDEKNNFYDFCYKYTKFDCNEYYIYINVDISNYFLENKDILLSFSNEMESSFLFKKHKYFFQKYFGEKWSFVSARLFINECESIYLYEIEDLIKNSYLFNYLNNINNIKDILE